jgi:flagellar motor switch/type III secretory pathway protein FliN
MTLRDVSLEASVVMGHLDLTLSELVRLGPGDRFEVELKGPRVAAELVAGGKVLARGHIVEDQDLRYFELTEVGGGHRSRSFLERIVDGVGAKRVG